MADEVEETQEHGFYRHTGGIEANPITAWLEQPYADWQRSGADFLWIFADRDGVQLSGESRTYRALSELLPVLEAAFAESRRLRIGAGPPDVAALVAELEGAELVGLEPNPVSSYDELRWRVRVEGGHTGAQRALALARFPRASMDCTDFYLRPPRPQRKWRWRKGE